MEKLISMVDFVLKSQDEQSLDEYGKFLNQKLELWMFVPCDKNGKILKYPEPPKNHNPLCPKLIDLKILEKRINEYQEAKNRVLFSGWELVHNGKWGAEIAIDRITGNNQINITKYLSVEKLLNEKQLFLTPTAQKKIGLTL